MHFKLLTLLLTFVTSCSCGTSNGKLFLVNNRGLDYKFQGKKDEHRFGVEVDENRQFHHTITDADGVRLGCYGYELYGLKYSTNYIADGKGYRLAPKNSDVITVYAKDTLEPRKASFFGSFGESEIKTGHIRYIFPEGCEAPKVRFDSLTREENRKKLIDALQNDALQNQNDLSSQRGLRKFEIQKYNSTKEVQATPPVSTTTVTPQEDSITTILPDTNFELKLSEFPNDSPRISFDDKCCENRIKLMLPRNDEVDSCSKMAKILIPISAEKLSFVPLKEIMSLSSNRSTLVILQNLLELVEKYNL